MSGVMLRPPLPVRGGQPPWPDLRSAEAMERDATWNEVHQRLGAFIAKRVANRSDADDILQEVFLRLHRHGDRIAQPDRLVAWIFQTTRNAIVDHYRAAGRAPVGPLTPAIIEALADRPSAADPSTAALASGDDVELANCLGPMIDRLPEPYREAIRVVELEGATQEAAAHRLGLSVPGMKSRVQRGREKLRQMLHACCRVEIDRRGNVAGCELRDPGCNPCARPDGT